MEATEAIQTFDFTVERPISLPEAAELLPRKGNGAKLTIRTLERWIRHGHKGVKLDAVKFGAFFSTSVEALQRFSVRLMAQDGVTVEAKTAQVEQRTPAEAKRGHDRAKRELASSGWGGKKHKSTKAGLTPAGK